MPRHQLQTVGGTRNGAIFSGQVLPNVSGSAGAVAVGSDVLFWSGAGRLTAVIPHQTVLTLSGVNAMFYDAGIPVSGGPIPASGHIPIGGLGVGAGVSGQDSPAGIPIFLGISFASGLCYNSRSGQTGITVSWSPDP